MLLASSLDYNLCVCLCVHGCSKFYCNIYNRSFVTNKLPLLDYSKALDETKCTYVRHITYTNKYFIEHPKKWWRWWWWWRWLQNTTIKQPGAGALHMWNYIFRFFFYLLLFSIENYSLRCSYNYESLKFVYNIYGSFVGGSTVVGKLKTFLFSSFDVQTKLAIVTEFPSRLHHHHAIVRVD